MTKKQVLELLRELLRTAFQAHTDQDDVSGYSTIYLVDQEQLMRNIEVELEKISPEEVQHE